MVNALSVTEKA